MTRDKDLAGRLTPDAFTRAMQGAVDAFKVRSNFRVYGVPDPQLWADEQLLRFGPRSPAQAVESILIEAVKELRQNNKEKARRGINRAKYILLNYC